MRLMMLVSWFLFGMIRIDVGNADQAIELDPTYAKAYFR
jgi:hypothetical protein